MTGQDLMRIMPFATTANVNKYTPWLVPAMGQYDINTPKRMAAFISQLAHESGCFRYVREIASGAAYEGRKDLGNTQAGDGVRFKGRGLIQITGRFNYAAAGKAFGVDFISNPELLETPQYATLVAAWYWKKHGLNELADAGNFEKITKVINGGTNGAAERRQYHERAKIVFGVS